VMANGTCAELDALNNVWEVFGIPPSKHVKGDCLETLALSIKNPPESFYFTVQELDELVAGSDPETDALRIEAGGYMAGLLPAVDWWIAVLDAIAFEKDGHSVTGTDFKDERAHCVNLLHVALTTYSDALRGTYRFEDDVVVEAHIKLLKSYHLFTRAVCAYAEQVWPEVSFSALRAQF
jgi:hypothetical protein